MTESNPAKFNMIQQQIRPWEVLDDRVLDVFDQLDREFFVPEALKGLAYADCQLPAVGEQRMLPPTVEGRMLQALNLKPSDLVLEIGCCSGYITACLAKLARHVDSIDFNPDAIALAGDNLAELGISNVSLSQTEDLANLGFPAKYDAIAVTAGSLDEIPQNLLDGLAIGGRLFTISGQSPAKHAVLVTRVGQNEWTRTSLFETDIASI